MIKNPKLSIATLEINIKTLSWKQEEPKKYGVIIAKSRGTRGMIANSSTPIADQRGRGNKRVIVRGSDFTERRREASQSKTNKRKRGNGSPESRATQLLRWI
jgi:hypothetical protein